MGWQPPTAFGSDLSGATEVYFYLSPCISLVPCEPLEFLGRSSVRREILHALVDDRRTVRDVTDTVDASRVTVQRNLRTLVQRGWVAENGCQYTATATGRLVVDAYDSFRQRLETVERLEPFLEHVDPSELDIAALSGATVTASTSTDPHAPVMAFLDWLGDASTFRAVTPAVGPSYVRAVAEQVDDGADVELVVAASHADRLEQDHPEASSTMSAADGCRVAVVDGPVPFGLGLSADGVAVAAYEDGIMRALLLADDEDAVAWGERTFERYAGDARSW